MATPPLLYDHLVSVARSGRTTTYGEVASILGLDLTKKQDREHIIHLLLDVACNENAEGRPLLPFVVVQPEIGYPGTSFFLLARELGTNNCCDDRSYFSYELRRVHDYWGKQIPNYQYQAVRMMQMT